jgi:hypothetical protein
MKPLTTGMRRWLCRCSRTVPTCARRTMTGAAACRYFRKPGRSAPRRAVAEKCTQTPVPQLHAHTHARSRARSCPLTRTTHTHACPINTCKSHMHEPILTHTRTNALARTGTRTHTHAHTSTHTTHTHAHSQAGTSTHRDIRMHARFSRTERRSGERFPRRSSPLHYAADQGKYDVVRLLVANGADTTATSNANGCVRVECSHRCRAAGRTCCHAVAVLAL